MHTSSSENKSLDLQSGQAEVVRFLMSPESYPEDIETVERIDTHGAIVFLAGSKVYKLKRALRLPYLDFSTVEKRAAACRNELERNTAAATDIYIDAIPVTREADGSLKIEGQGEPVDWLVLMNRFEQADLLANMAAANAIDMSLMDPLAETIAAYHARARKCLDSDGDEIAARVITQIVTALSQATDILGLRETQQLAAGLVEQLNRHSRLLKTRSKSGLVRLCHGDLHLRNIVLNEGQPELFDALEFDNRLATTDILYDLAFLLMDLWHRNLKSQANRCFNTYVSSAMPAAELSGLSLVPLFMAMRAAIRAVVAIDKANVARSEADESAIEEACAYAALAKGLLKTSKPVLVAVGGYSGTGKSTLAAAMAPGLGHVPGALHLRSDVERKRMMRSPVLKKLPRQAYTSEVSQNVYRRLCNRAENALKAGHSVIVDAVFLEPVHRRWIEQVAARSGCGFLGLWLDADQDLLIQRVTDRRFDASDADGDVVRRQLIAGRRTTGWYSIDAGGTRASAVAQANQAVMIQLGRIVYSN